MSGQDPELLPGQIPPPGITPDFSRYYSNVVPEIVLCYLFFAFATVGFGTRLFVRAYVARKVEYEDYFFTSGWVGYAIIEGFTAPLFVHGAGRHQWDINIPNLAHFLWLLNVTSMVYDVAMLLLKFSVLVQLQRIFGGSKRGFVWWAINILQIVNALFYGANLVIAIFVCNPREKLWLPWLPGTCINSNALIFTSGVFNLASDITMLIIPLYAITKLNMSGKRKLGVFAIFATGSLGCVSSAVRLYFNVTLLTTNDFTWAYGPIAVVVSVEFASMILVASFPILPRLVLFFKQGCARKQISPPQFTLAKVESKSALVSAGGEDGSKSFVLESNSPVLVKTWMTPAERLETGPPNFSRR